MSLSSTSRNIKLILDPRTPKSAKWLFFGAVVYMVLPVDFVPDIVPVLGWLDDVVAVITLVNLAFGRIPAHLKQPQPAQVTPPPALNSSPRR